MGMLEPLTAFGLGRSPYDDIVTGFGGRPVTLRRQSYDNRGRPVNNLSRVLNRRTIRSHNEVMHVIGVAEPDSGPTTAEAQIQSQYFTYETTTGYHLHRISFAAIEAGIWSMNGLRNRLIVWRDLGNHPLHELVKGAHLEPGNAIGKLLFYGLPSHLFFKLLKKQWFRLPPNNALSFPSLRARQPWAIKLWSWFSVHTQVYIILQRLGIIQGYWLPNPMFYIPWSSASPIHPPPPFPSDLSTTSLALWAGQVLLTLAPMAAYITWVHVESRVKDLFSGFFHELLPTPQISGFFPPMPELNRPTQEAPSHEILEASLPLFILDVPVETPSPPYFDADTAAIEASASLENPPSPAVGLENAPPGDENTIINERPTTLQQNDLLTGPGLETSANNASFAASPPLSPSTEATYTNGQGNANGEAPHPDATSPENNDDKEATPSSTPPPNADPDPNDAASDASSTVGHPSQAQGSDTLPQPVPDPPSFSDEDDYGTEEDEADMVTGPLISFDVETSDPTDAPMGTGPWSAELRPTPVNESRSNRPLPLYLITMLSTEPHFMACEILSNFTSRVILLPLEFMMLRFLARSYTLAHPAAAAAMLAAGFSVGAPRLLGGVSLSTIGNILNIELAHLITMGDVWAALTLIGRQMHYTMKEWRELPEKPTGAFWYM
ncbi:hypothetical protein BROUX41_002137 [Berkeleyomyces rouxiae]|uniref:uncharacterized protein n=1 Tax=Berkeleyomyces rouxiae TaxID=2035830 RepID=UPI003B7A55E7